MNKEALNSSVLNNLRCKGSVDVTGVLVPFRAVETRRATSSPVKGVKH